MDLPINQIVRANNLELLETFPDRCIDLTVTSPPYDDLRTYKGFPDLDVPKLSKLLFRVTKDGGYCVWVVGDETIECSETGTSFKQALAFIDSGWKLHDTMIYEKSNFANPSTNRYHQIFEYMFVLSKGFPKTFNPIKDRLNAYSIRGGDCKRQKDGEMARGKNGGKPLDRYGMRCNIWRFTVGGGHVASWDKAHQHPALFPEQLVMDHIKSWSNEGDLILDPFNGSGTTCVGAYRLKRNYIGIDFSEEYCDLAIERLSREKDVKRGQIF